MKHTLTKGIGSSYAITVELNSQDRDTLHQKTLQSLQGEVKIQGFRPGHVPLHMVEKQIKPEYLKMAFLEECLNASIKFMIKDHADMQFIGQPYDLNNEEKDDTIILTYKLDTYPEVTVKNADWKKLTINAIDTTVSKEETAQALNNLKKQYADYNEAEVIGKGTLVKASYTMTDKDGAELHKGTAFFGEDEYTESALLWNAVEGKKKGDAIVIAYDEKKLPHAVHYHPHGDETAKKIKNLNMTILDTKDTVLPDFNDAATLTKLFQTPDITTHDALQAKVESVLVEQKEEQGLQQAVEAMLEEAKQSLEIVIPETFIKEEMGARIKQLGERMGGEEGLKQYFAKIGEDKVTELYDEIRKSAQESLGKFFILRKMVELLEIQDINWEDQLDAEKKIYARLAKADGKSAGKKVGAKNDAADESADASSEEAPKKKVTPKKKKDETDAE